MYVRFQGWGFVYGCRSPLFCLGKSIVRKSIRNKFYCCNLCIILDEIRAVLASRGCVQLITGYIMTNRDREVVRRACMALINLALNRMFALYTYARDGGEKTNV